MLNIPDAPSDFFLELIPLIYVLDISIIPGIPSESIDELLEQIDNHGWIKLENSSLLVFIVVYTSDELGQVVEDCMKSDIVLSTQPRLVLETSPDGSENEKSDMPTLIVFNDQPIDLVIRGEENETAT